MSGQAVYVGCASSAQPPKYLPTVSQPSLTHNPTLPISQVRANGLLVFVPKYGIEGPVHLDDADRAGKEGVSSSAPAAVDSAPGAVPRFVYDEEKQTVSREDGGVAYTIFDTCAVTISVEETAGNRRVLALRLTDRAQLPDGERMG